MDASHLQAALRLWRAKLAAGEQEVLAQLEASHGQAVKAIVPMLARLTDQMRKQQAETGTVSLSWLHESARLTTLLQLLTKQVDAFAVVSQSAVGRFQHQALDWGVQTGQALLQASVPRGVSWSFGLPSRKALAELVGVTADGSPLARLFRRWGEEAAGRVRAVLTTGVTLGWNPRTIAPQVHEALGISRNRALVIARQEGLRCYKNAATETYRANSDTVEQWRWTAALSGRTCAACLAMDGKLFPVTQDLESHVCCRCTPVPVTRPWSAIFTDAGLPVPASLSAISSTPPPWPSGADWLAKQSERVQRQVLGNKYAGYVAGDFGLQDLVKHHDEKEWGHSISVKSQKELERA